MKHKDAVDLVRAMADAGLHSVLRKTANGMDIVEICNSHEDAEFFLGFHQAMDPLGHGSYSISPGQSEVPMSEDDIALDLKERQEFLESLP